MLGLVFGLALSSVPVYATQENDQYQDYLAKKEACSTSADFAKLAEHPHCQRLQYVKAWQLQRAAWLAWQEEDVEGAAKYASQVLDIPDSVKKTSDGHPTSPAAGAHGILGAVASGKGDWREAVSQYSKAIELDNGYAQARSGLEDANKSLNKEGKK